MTTHRRALHERADLDEFTRQNAFLLVQEEVLRGAKEYSFEEQKIYSSIGHLACNLALVGENESAEKLAAGLMDEVGITQEQELSVWTVAAENGAQIADRHIRSLMGLRRDRKGNTILGGTPHLEEGRIFPLLYLYKFGDASIAPHLHRHIEQIEDSRAEYGVRLAVKLFDAGDDSAYQLVKTTAERVRAYALSQEIEDEELSADDATDFGMQIKGLASALTPPRSKTESLCAQSDIALKYFAQSLLKNGDVHRADEIQSLILSGFDNAWVNAQRVALGYDPDGSRAEAAKYYLATYGDVAGGHQLDITNALVAGGDPESIALYQDVYDAGVRPGHVDARSIGDMLVALHLSGDKRAHRRLMQLITDPEDVYVLIDSLDNMGLKNEAVAVARKAFRKNPNYLNGLMILNLQYDREAMIAVQNGASEYHRSLIEVVHSHSRHLGNLAIHINDIEQTAKKRIR